MSLPRQPPPPPRDEHRPTDLPASHLLSPVRTERLTPRLVGLLGGTVLLIGPLPLDGLRALAGSASRIILLGPDPTALKLIRRALDEDRIQEVDAVVARPSALPFRRGGVDGALVFSPSTGIDPEITAELEHLLAGAPAFAITPAEAKGRRDELIAAGGLALRHLGGEPRQRPSFPESTGSQLPSLSVVIPTRNRARLLSRALLSVRAQDVPPAEIVVVDDGSTDSTAAIVEQHGSHVRCVRLEPAGQGAAMNAGIATTTGDWIAWLDDDDCFLPAKLRLQLRTLEDDPRIGLAVTAHYVGDAEGRPLEARSVPSFSPENVLRLLLRGSIFLGPTAMVRRAAYEELGERPYDEGLTRAADYAMWWRLVRRWRVAVIQVPLTVVCRHSGNALDLARARTIYDSVRRTLRWVWENVPLDELAAGSASLSEVRLERGEALLRVGLTTEARADIEATGDVEPERAMNLLGLLALESADFPAAQEHFGRVLGKTPESRNALNGLATALMLGGRKSEARRVLARALAAHPHDHLIRYNAGLVDEASSTSPGPGLVLARDLMVELGVRGALFSPAPPLRGIDAYFAHLRRESWRRDGGLSAAEGASLPAAGVAPAGEARTGEAQPD